MSGMTHTSYKTITPCTDLHSSTLTSHTYMMQSHPHHMLDSADGAGCGEVAAQRARACTRRACVRRPDSVRTGSSARRLRPIAQRDTLVDLPAACARRAILRQPLEKVCVPFLANALEPDGAAGTTCTLRALRRDTSVQVCVAPVSPERASQICGSCENTENP